MEESVTTGYPRRTEEQLDIIIVIVLALAAGAAVYQVSMSAGQPGQPSDTPRMRIRDALRGIVRVRNPRVEAGSGAPGVAGPESLVAGRSVEASAGSATPLATGAQTAHPATPQLERTEGDGEVDPTPSGSSSAPQEQVLYGGSLPPVTVPPDYVPASGQDRRYVPLATGYRSFQTRVIGFVGLVVLVAILSVAITVSLYVASSAVVTKLVGPGHSSSPSVPAKVTKGPGSQGSHHATPGSAAG